MSKLLVVNKLGPNTIWSTVVVVVLVHLHVIVASHEVKWFVRPSGLPIRGTAVDLLRICVIGHV